jgi:hypothetical protein
MALEFILLKRPDQIACRTAGLSRNATISVFIDK